MALVIITIFFLLLYGLLIFFYYSQWNRLETYKPSAVHSSVFVSVIIAARNEEKTLPWLLKDLYQQDYPAELWEVIIVNDHSTDNTASLANSFKGDSLRMILPEATAETSSKKIAIATGVKETKGELLIITDADCRVNKNWVSTIAKFYQQTDAVFIVAPVKFSHDQSLLQLFQALDFITLQGITAASVSANFHSMCNGANLAYTKQAFESVNGFEGIDNVATGDDMLLMHKIWKKHPGKVMYLKSEQAIVSTAPMKTWKDFFMQRKRWASKTLVYDDWRIIAVLAFIFLFNLLFFVLLATAFFNKMFWLLAFIFLAVKTLLEWPFVSSVAAFYKEKKLMPYFFFIQPLHIFYTVSVGLLSQFGKYEWKGRRMR